jgi:hypothetical protein
MFTTKILIQLLWCHNGKHCHQSILSLIVKTNRIIYHSHSQQIHIFAQMIDIEAAMYRDRLSGLLIIQQAKEECMIDTVNLGLCVGIASFFCAVVQCPMLD